MLSVHSKPNDPNRIVDSQNPQRSERWDQNSAYHRWPLLRGEKVRAFMPRAEARSAQWPKTSESFVVPALETEIKARGANVQRFIAMRGDVLIWHGRLLHRGSQAKQPGMMRKAVICHYSGVSHRAEMPNRRRDPNGHWYMTLGARRRIAAKVRKLLSR